MFQCWDNMADTVIHSEIGATQAIVEAGFTFDSLMLRYQVGAPCCAVLRCGQWVRRSKVLGWGGTAEEAGWLRVHGS